MRIRVALSALVLLTAARGGATEIARGAVAGDGLAFVASADGTLAALDVATGAVRWSSREALRPLAVDGGRLLAHGPAEAGRLRLVFLDAATGANVGEESIALPADVAAPLDDTGETRFLVRLEQAGSRVRLEWTWDFRPMRGVYEEDGADEGEDAGARPRRSEGAVEVDLRAGRATAVASRTVSLPALPSALAAEAEAGRFRERPLAMGSLLVATEASRQGLLLKRWRADGAALPDVPLPDDVTLQLGSADGRHVTVSREVGGPPESAHEWTVLALDTGARVATLRTSTAAAGFAVAGTRLLVAQQPWEHRTAAGWRAEPRRLEAFDLASGAPAWTREIRDASYRGPVAP
jgi:hypothetical protein